MQENSALEMLAAYLKSIVFFKIITYSFTVVGLLLLLRSLQADLRISRTWYNEATQNLHSAEKKFTAITGSAQTLFKINEKYQTITTVNEQNACNSRLSLVNKIRNTADLYNLTEPIQIKISDSVLNGGAYFVGGRVRIKHYNLHIKFATYDFNSALKLSSDTYALMPKHTIPLSIKINLQDFLIPETISKLSTHAYPNLVNSELSVMITEIITKG